MGYYEKAVCFYGLTFKGGTHLNRSLLDTLPNAVVAEIRQVFQAGDQARFLARLSQVWEERGDLACVGWHLNSPELGYLAIRATLHYNTVSVRGGSALYPTGYTSFDMPEVTTDGWHDALYAACASFKIAWQEPRFHLIVYDHEVWFFFGLILTVRDQLNALKVLRSDPEDPVVWISPADNLDVLLDKRVRLIGLNRRHSEPLCFLEYDAPFVPRGSIKRKWEIAVLSKGSQLGIALDTPRFHSYVL